MVKFQWRLHYSLQSPTPCSIQSWPLYGFTTTFSFEKFFIQQQFKQRCPKTCSIQARPIFFQTKGRSRTIMSQSLYGTGFGALESIMATLLKLLLNKDSSKIRSDIFFKTKGCSKTIQRPCLYGTSFGALDSSIMATLLKFDHCGCFPFCTLQTVPKLKADSSQKPMQFTVRLRRLFG